jgi:hypothetical protein
MYSAKVTELCLHLLDLGLLPRDDLLAKTSNVRITDGRLFAHKNRARMVRNHRLQELTIRDRGLSPDKEKKRGERRDTSSAR